MLAIEPRNDDEVVEMYWVLGNGQIPIVLLGYIVNVCWCPAIVCCNVYLAIRKQYAVGSENFVTYLDSQKMFEYEKCSLLGFVASFAKYA